jgi:hypothetical protein
MCAEFELVKEAQLAKNPNGCDVWTIAGCGTAVAALYGPLGPGDIGCVLAMLAAIGIVV